jgi:large subunit ribosomal protein L6
MSRIGNAPIVVPKEVTVKTEGNTMVFTGPKGEARFVVSPGIEVSQEGANLVIKRKHNDKKTKSLHGFVRAAIANHIHGISNFPASDTGQICRELIWFCPSDFPTR